MPELGLARSLVEGYLYLDLAAREVGGNAAERATLTEGEESWTLRLDGVEVEVPYQGEATARLDELTFGEGRSELIDPGQWVFVAGTYARRTLSESLSFTANPDDDEQFENVAAGWQFAADAIAEALKFLPPGADAVPAEACWTPMGRALHEANPERFTRQQLESDLLFYRQNLEDFWQLHRPDDDAAF
ncbi:hypothetical protein ACWENQ_09585 [Nonomuraea sp. NPDC004354]